MENRTENQSSGRLPLSEVVADCVRRWFTDTLKEAKAGDINMQVLLGQMYHNGYGVPRDAQMGRIWLTKASRGRSSVWKVGDKHPGKNPAFPVIGDSFIVLLSLLKEFKNELVWLLGYNASDSDSDELKGDSQAD